MCKSKVTAGSHCGIPESSGTQFHRALLGWQRTPHFFNHTANLNRAKTILVGQILSFTHWLSPPYALNATLCVPRIKLRTLINNLHILCLANYLSDGE